MELEEQYENLADKLRALGHILQLDDEGIPDIFASEYEFHNGFKCTRCSEIWCVHCWNSKDELDRCMTDLELKEEAEAVEKSTIETSIRILEKRGYRVTKGEIK